MSTVSTVSTAFESALGAIPLTVARETAVKAAKDGVAAIDVADIAKAIEATGVDAGLAEAAAKAAKQAIADKL